MAILRTMFLLSIPSRSFSTKCKFGNHIVFLGAPGVGKGTFAGKLAPALGIPSISSGDIIRAEIKSNGPLSDLLKSYANSGNLVPDEVVTKLVTQRLQQDDTKNGWILDGFPRTIEQAKDLDRLVNVNIAINYVMKDDILVEKILGRRICKGCGKNFNVADINRDGYTLPPLNPPADCNICHGDPELYMRDDDTEEIALHRLNVYKSETAPLVDYYASQNKLMNFETFLGLADVPRLFTELGVTKE